MMSALTTWDPWRSFSLLRRDMDDLFNRFFGDWEREFTPWLQTGSYYLPIESYVEGNHLIVKADLPGVDPNDIQVTVEGNQLTIQGERKAEHEQRRGHSFHREVRYGSFSRTLTLPEGVKADDIQARYHNGVLEISLPCPASMVTRKVPVQIAGGEEPKKLAA